jgi:CheY-like chemotaxis protein
MDMTSSAAVQVPKPQVLIVEDETIIAMDIAMQLRDLGYEPLGPAITGEQAIEMAVRLRPSLVLMDIHLRGEMDGITAAQEIRTRADIGCVFLSAFTEGESLARATRTNPVGYLAKPFTEYELRTVLRASLKQA